MTDAPEGPGAQAERGSRRAPRVGDSGSPVGSTLSIVLAVVAVVAGFLILRAITDDDDGGDDDITLESVPSDSTTAQGTGDAASTTVAGEVTTTTAGRVTTGATVVVANASGIGGSAAAMSTALEGAGYAMGEPGNTTEGQLDTSVVYYVTGDVAAQAVAASVAADMGGLVATDMPSPPPIDAGLGTSTVLVMVGTDTANKTLADMNPSSVEPPAAEGATTTSTTVAGD